MIGQPHSTRLQRLCQRRFLYLVEHWVATVSVCHVLPLFPRPRRRHIVSRSILLYLLKILLRVTSDLDYRLRASHMLLNLFPVPVVQLQPFDKLVMLRR